MTLKQFIFISPAAIFLFYCNPKALLTGVTHTSNVDSVLFYRQNPVADPFLDEIQSNPGNSARLTTLLLPPPPPPPPNYREIEGFRIQLFAGSDSIGALSVQSKVDIEVDDPVYLIHEGGLYKVQVGDYPYRMTADSMKLALNNKGYDGAWVAKRMIRIPLDSSVAGLGLQLYPPPPPVHSEAQPEEIVPVQTVDTISTQGAETVFKIQVIATSDELKAQQMELELENQFSQDAYYEQLGTVYKVFIGRFQTRTDAEKLLIQIRQNGYPDAWLVY